VKQRFGRRATSSWARDKWKATWLRYTTDHYGMYGSARPSFRRELLPNPAAVYGMLSKFKAYGHWAWACCPFHPDMDPSFRVNLRTGGFECASCGITGQSLIDFIMERDCVDFVTATKLLGAWR
jgi:hypothetical protein